jgi:bifunctional UDP-N-acetylglucosamine pyrophosphorylase/glucosamine-1-phosphate N-acetyltransferase
MQELGVAVVGGKLLQKSHKVRHSPGAMANLALELAEGTRPQAAFVRSPASWVAGHSPHSPYNERNMSTPPVTVAILAAGLGTRMRSRKAKVLHRAGGLTLVEHVVNAALSIAPPERIFAVTGHQAEEVEGVLGGTGIQTIRQTEQKGTGHAVMVGRDRLSQLSGYLVILYGDCPLLTPDTLGRLIDRQQKSDAAATVITTLLKDPTGYGRVLIGADGNVNAIVEQKAGTPEQLAVKEINSGIYCFRSELLWKHIGEIQPNNAAGEYYLTDIIELFRRAGHAVASLRLDDPSEILGINTRIELAESDRILRARKVREVLLAGVTIEQPETVTIDAAAQIGMDTIIGPFTQIRGRTVIGSDCRIGAASIITDSRIDDEVEVGPFSIIDKSRVGKAAGIGPFARLRFEADVEPGAHVGNFVELKKTRLGSGAKAMHLAYLGDSVIGSKVNVGAGTITCNYDGLRKHQTTIGAGAFVGSNSTLVAPVEIGAGSYVGAGSVITDPVPEEALALGRGRQVVKEGWVKQKRSGSSSDSTAR